MGASVVPHQRCASALTRSVRARGHVPKDRQFLAVQKVVSLYAIILFALFDVRCFAILFCDFPDTFSI